VRFHADTRSPKIAEVARDGRATVLGYDAPARLQLRLSGTAWVETNTAEADAAWAKAALFSRRCYLSEHAPGAALPGPASGVPADLENAAPTAARSESGRAVFSILKIEVSELDWYFLAHQGHRRAVFSWRNDAWSAQWLAP
jgi:pyridoxamine 5'-phosphate oxidase